MTDARFDYSKTTTDCLERVFSALQRAGCDPQRLPSGKIRARCPCHDDQVPSLFIGADSYKVLIHDFGGCDTANILAAIGLEFKDLYPDDSQERQKPPQPETPKALKTTSYEIKARDGTLVAIHKRIDLADGSKRFHWLCPDGSPSQGTIKTANLPLYGIHELNELNAKGFVVVTEGEKARDALARIGVPAVGTVCGAATIPCDECLRDLLGNEIVYLWPDNDDAGRRHMERIAQRLLTLGHKDVRIISWSEAPEHSDAADFVAKYQDPKAARAAVNQLLEQAHSWQPQAAMSYEALKDVFARWLYFPDDLPLRYVLSLVIANKLEGDPVWGFLIAPLGGTKTELINALAHVEGVYPLSDLTAQTFASGMRGDRVSLLERIPPNAILTLKDFTTVLSMHRDARQAVLAQLREIYDGTYSKEFGTGKKVEWRGKLSLIAGVTPIIDQFTTLYATLGERFLQLRIRHGSVEDLAKKVTFNRGHEKEMRKELIEAVARFLGSLTIAEVPIPQKILDAIIAAARFIALGRSQVIRESYVTRDIELVPEPELPTRVLKQLSNLAVAHAILLGKPHVDSADLELIAAIAQDSIPRNRLRVLLDLRAYGESETTQVAERLDLPTSTTRRLLEDVTALGMAQRMKQGPGQSDLWVLSPEFATLWERFAPTSDAHERVETTDGNDTLPTLSEKSTSIYYEEREGVYHPSDFSGKPTGVQAESAKSTLSRVSEDPSEDDIPF